MKLKQLMEGKNKYTIHEVLELSKKHKILTSYKGGFVCLTDIPSTITKEQTYKLFDLMKIPHSALSIWTCLSSAHFEADIKQGNLYKVEVRFLSVNDWWSQESIHINKPSDFE